MVRPITPHTSQSRPETPLNEANKAIASPPSVFRRMEEASKLRAAEMLDENASPTRSTLQGGHDNGGIFDDDSPSLFLPASPDGDLSDSRPGPFTSQNPRKRPFAEIGQSNESQGGVFSSVDDSAQEDGMDFFDHVKLRGMQSQDEDALFRDNSIFSTSSVFSRPTLMNGSQLSSASGSLDYSGKNVDWKHRASLRSSCAPEQAANPLQLPRAKFSLFKGVRKVLNSVCTEMETPIEGDALEWTEKTIGLTARPGEGSMYWSPEEWLCDDIKIEVEVKTDVAFSSVLLPFVLESSRLEKQGLRNERAMEEEQAIEDYYPYKDGQFSAELQDKLETIVTGMRCQFSFSGYRSIINHFRYLKEVPPINAVKPSHYESHGVLSALSDSLNGVCSLNLRVIDPNFFETGLRIASLNLSGGKEMRELLLRAAKERFIRIMKLAQEEAMSILSDSSRTSTIEGGHISRYGPIGSTINLMERNHEAETGANMGDTGAMSSQSTTAGAGARHASKRGSITHRNRRGSIVRSGDDAKMAFLQNLTNSEKQFYERYSRQLMPRADVTSKSIFDNMVMQLSVQNQVSAALVLNLDPRLFPADDEPDYYLTGVVGDDE